MKTAELLARLGSLDVRLWFDGERLRYSAPPGVLTPPMRVELAAHKTEICSFLRKAQKAVVDTDRPVLPLSHHGHQPLSFSQQRLWFIDQLSPANAAYHVPAAIRLSGSLNLAALEQAISEIVRRHEILRTTFVVAEGKPAQVVGPALYLSLSITSLEGLTKAEQEIYTHKLATEHATAAFDLSRGPLLRTSLLRLNDREHVLLVAMHHIVSDGWSLGLLIREVAALYEAFSQGRSSPLPELAIQYADFARWQREWLSGPRLEEQVKYWKQQLGDAPILALPMDGPRPSVQTFQGMSCSLLLSESLCAALQELSRQAGATMFMTMLAAFHALLHRYAQQATILTGTPVANRTRAETEPLIGFFVNTLVLRSDFAADPSFLTHLERVRRQALGAYAHQDLPFELLVEELQLARDLSYNPLFQVMFSWEEAGWSELRLAGVEVSAVAVANQTSQFDLTLTVGEWGGGLRCALQYNTALFRAESIRRMLGHYEELLRSVVREPQQRVSRLPLLSGGERQQLLREWNETAVEYDEASATLGELFERQVERAEQAVAVVSGEREVRYGELNEGANRVARHLRELGMGAEARVGLLLERGVELVVGLLGIIKAGAAYVPLDASYPVVRLEYMLRDAAVSVVLTEQRLRRLAHEVAAGAATVLCLDEAWAAEGSAENVPAAATSENLAYIIYTSGSTGQPKGVMISQRAICNHMLWMHERFPLRATDAVLQKTPFSFDASVWEFYAPLLAGARLVMAQPGGHQDAAYLVDVMEREGVTRLQGVPTLLRLLVSEGGLERCTQLREVFSGGEVLRRELAESLLRAHSEVKLYNLYGPTEATIDTTWQEAERGRVWAGEEVGIGRPIANMQVYVLDAEMQVVPVGVVGELYIGGEGLARGYLNRAELTAEKFVPHPYSEKAGARLYRTGDMVRWRDGGELAYIDRVDAQVKLRGFRIELGEIETVLKQHAGVCEVLVVDRELKRGERQLVAYVVGRAEKPPTEGELRDHLRSSLPEYMVPAAFVFLPAMPLSPNGKIDRRALPLPEQEPVTRELRSAPVTELEREIARVWQAVLQVEHVGVHDKFFDIGGHSLLMIQVQKNLAATLEREINLLDLFKYPTINSLSRHLGQNGHKPLSSGHGPQTEKLQSGKARLQKLKLKQRAARVSR